MALKSRLAAGLGAEFINILTFDRLQTDERAQLIGEGCAQSQCSLCLVLIGAPRSHRGNDRFRQLPDSRNLHSDFSKADAKDANRRGNRILELRIDELLHFCIVFGKVVDREVFAEITEQPANERFFGITQFRPLREMR